MSAVRALYALLLLIAGAAAVLSFSALRDLAVVCGFSTRLAPLLPVVIDAGATAGAVAWLGRWDGPGRAFGRTLALALLATSVAGNALGHGLAAYSLAPAWWVVVIVSAVAPAVLFAVVHLAVLVLRGDQGPASDELEVLEDGSVVVEELEDGTLVLENGEVATPEPWECKRDRLLAEGVGRTRLARELGISEFTARQLLDEHRQARREGAG